MTGEPSHLEPAASEQRVIDATISLVRLLARSAAGEADRLSTLEQEKANGLDQNNSEQD